MSGVSTPGSLVLYLRLFSHIHSTLCFIFERTAKCSEAAVSSGMIHSKNSKLRLHFSVNFVNLTLTKQGNLRQSHQRISLSFSKFLLPGRSSHKPVHFDPTHTVQQKRQAKQQEQWSSQSNKIKEQKILRVRHLAMYAYSESKPSHKQTKTDRFVGLMFSKI